MRVRPSARASCRQHPVAGDGAGNSIAQVAQISQDKRCRKFPETWPGRLVRVIAPTFPDWEVDGIRCVTGGFSAGQPAGTGH
jgi:hypothetical protein